MNELELEIFEQSSGYSELRLRAGGELRTRGLDRTAIDHLIEVVERAYAEDSIAQRVFGSAGLRDLGELLFSFLDGDERWFSQVLADPRGSRCGSRRGSGCVIFRGSWSFMAAPTWRSATERR